jgi:hypothetical protein
MGIEHAVRLWWASNAETFQLVGFCIVAAVGVLLYIFRYAILVQVVYRLGIKPRLPKPETEEEMEARIAAEVHDQWEADIAEIDLKYKTEQAISFNKNPTKNVDPRRN